MRDQWCGLVHPKLAAYQQMWWRGSGLPTSSTSSIRLLPRTRKRHPKPLPQSIDRPCPYAQRWSTSDGLSERRPGATPATLGAGPAVERTTAVDRQPGQSTHEPRLVEHWDEDPISLPGYGS